MKAFASAATLVAIAGCTTTDTVSQNTIARSVYNPSPIVISCYRGPWNEVIWDRPNSIFLDGLRKAGYSRADAKEIAYGICRDENGVDKPEYLVLTLKQMMTEKPPSQ